MKYGITTVLGSCPGRQISSISWAVLNEDPLLYFVLLVVASQIYRDSAAGAVEAALMPWNGRQDVLIDRFDARAVLDMVPLSPKVGYAAHCRCRGGSKDCRGPQQFRVGPTIARGAQRLRRPATIAKGGGTPLLPHIYPWQQTLNQT